MGKTRVQSRGQDSTTLAALWTKRRNLTKPLSTTVAICLVPRRRWRSNKKSPSLRPEFTVGDQDGVGPENGGPQASSTVAGGSVGSEAEKQKTCYCCSIVTSASDVGLFHVSYTDSVKGGVIGDHRKGAQEFLDVCKLCEETFVRLWT